MRPANPELALASRKVRVGHIAQLPDGTRWLRVDARKETADGRDFFVAQEEECDDVEH